MVVGLLLAAGCADGRTNNGPTGQPYPGSNTTTGEPSTSSPDFTTTSDGQVPANECCMPAQTPGCIDDGIADCVCANDPACCINQWSVSCVGVAQASCGVQCGDAPPATTTEASTTDATTGESDASSSTTTSTPGVTCGDLAEASGYTVGVCEAGGNGACGGVGPETLDCDHCCDVCDAGITCGDLATRQGWAAANCESDTNNACGGQGTPTCDCNFCCEVGG